jgi:hypothetical protein
MEAQIDMVELEMMVANMLRSAIESLQAPKCRALERQEQICDTCGSAQPSSASSGDAYAVRSDAYGSAGSANYNSGSRGSASYNSGSAGSASYNSGFAGSANYNSGSHGSGSYNSGSHGSDNYNSGSYKMKSTDGNVRMPSLQEDLNMDSYNLGNMNHGNMNHGQQMNNNQEQWNSHGNYQYNNDQYYAPQK